MDFCKKDKKFISSLVDLKAELYRKKEEFKRQKEGNVSFTKAKKTEKKLGVLSRQNAGVSARAQRDLDTREDSLEDEDILLKSRRILEQKAKVYESITNSSSIPEEDGSEFYLVDFQKKSIDALVEEREEQRRREVEEAEREEKEIPIASCPEEEWVDFVDSLGRERRCMKKDLPHLMEKDRLLAMKVASGSRKASLKDDAKETESTCLPEMMSPDMHRDMMRQKWEAEAQAMIDRGQEEVHYSNVQFDEIRTHGVGFFQFSKDHAEREEEMEKLKKIREETKDERSRKDKIKEKRQAMIEVRLAKVRQRKGLKQAPSKGPDVKEEAEAETNDTIGPKISEAITALRKEESEKEKRAAEEKRQNHVREWDEEKVKSEGWGAKNYVSERRKERDNDFAPPSNYFEQPRIFSRKSATSSKISKPSSKTSNNLELEQHYLSQNSKFDNSNPQQPIDQYTSSIAGVHRVPGNIDTGKQENSVGFSASDSHVISPNIHQQQIPQTIVNTCKSQIHHQPPPPPLPTPSFSQPNQQWVPVQPQTNSHPFQLTHDYYGYTTGMAHSSAWAGHYQGGDQIQPHPSMQINSSTTSTPYPSQYQHHHSVPYDTQHSTSSISGSVAYVKSHNNKNRHQDKQKSNHGSNVKIPRREMGKREETNKPPIVKKVKVPKDFIIDTRWVNNFDPSSINPEPGQVPHVEGLPYVPGSYSKYQPLGHATRVDADQSDVGMSECSDGASISGGPLIYTPQQLERQRKELIDAQEDHLDSQIAENCDADKKVQDFLSSIRSQKN